MKDNSKPAFPYALPPTANRDGHICEGMTLRQWYAGQAMKGLVSNPSHDKVDDSTIARWAWQQADAMLAQEEK